MASKQSKRKQQRTRIARSCGSSERARDEATQAQRALQPVVERAVAVLQEGHHLSEQLAAASAELERRVTAAEAERRGIDAPNGAHPATVHEGGGVGRVEEGLLRRLEQLVVAQQRTNELLELALGEAFDDDRSFSLPAPASPVMRWRSEVGGRGPTAPA